MFSVNLLLLTSIQRYKALVFIGCAFIHENDMTFQFHQISGMCCFILKFKYFVRCQLCVCLPVCLQLCC